MNDDKLPREMLDEIPDSIIHKMDNPLIESATSDVESSLCLLYHMLPAEDRRLNPLCTPKDVEDEFDMCNEVANSKLDNLVEDGILTKSEHKARGYTFASDHWRDVGEMSDNHGVVFDGGSMTYEIHSPTPTSESHGSDSSTPPQVQCHQDPQNEKTQLLDRSRGMPLLPLSVMVAASGIALLTSTSSVVLVVSTCLVFLLASVAKMLEPPTAVFNTFTDDRLRTA